MRTTTIGLITILSTFAAIAEERPVQLKPAAGMEKVQENCAACHSLDYVRMNSTFLDAAGWGAEVNKMIKAFGAPISEADAQVITGYLTQAYGVKAGNVVGRR
jgi:sulfite dehydrogenase (cytochrome) subunit B